MKPHAISMALILMLPDTPVEEKLGYGKNDILFGKFYKIATKTIKRLLKDVFDIMFYRTRIFIIDVWPLTVQDYCFQVLGWSNKKFRDSFNAEERKHCGESVESMEGDVTLLNKLIMKLFDDRIPDTFYNELREMKNVRNRVCHDQLDINDESLHRNVEDLKVLFMKFLDEVEKIFSCDMSLYQQKYIDEIDAIMSAAMTEEGLSYFEKMEKFREDLMGKFIISGRKELTSLYSKLKILNPFTWLRDDKFSALQVDKIFTPLHISDQNIMIDLESLLVVKPLDEETRKLKDFLPSVLILTGIAGCGKTSLCRYLLYDWWNTLGTVTNMRSVDILIFIEARNVTTNSLLTYLQQTLLKETCSHFESKDILPTLQSMNVLYIVDGMDEATTDGKQLLNELFSVLGNARVVLTTRPEFAAFVDNLVSNQHLTSMRIQIHGFSDEGIGKFVSKLFISFESDEEARRQQEAQCLKFLRTTGRSLGSHLKIPLTLALLIILWKDDKSSITRITSVTRLYSEIVKMCSMKMLSRIRMSASTNFDSETFLEEWMSEFTKTAYDMMKKDHYILKKEHRKTLSSICSRYNVDSLQVLSAFLICEVREEITGVQHVFSFIHKSQMEYLAGQYEAELLMLQYGKQIDHPVFQTQKRLRWLSTKTNKLEPEMLNVSLFIIGHLCLQDDVQHDLVKKVAMDLIYVSDIVLKNSDLWRIVQESDCHPDICAIVEKSIASNFVWKIEDEDLHHPMDPTMLLIKYTDFTPSSLLIRIVSKFHNATSANFKKQVETESMDNLLASLQCAAEKPELPVILKVDQHFYNWGDADKTDHLIEALLPRGNLTKFRGHLGAQGVKSIFQLKGLQTFHIRISDIDALHAIGSSFSFLKNYNMELILRLDISTEVAVDDLPTFSEIPPFTIVLRNIDDSNALWASQVLIKLCKRYDTVELLSCSLTDIGGKEFLRSLSSGKVKVVKAISVRTFQNFNKKTFKVLRGCGNFKLEWW